VPMLEERLRASIKTYFRLFHTKYSTVAMHIAK
jgi:hypothetical protein